MSLPFTRRLVVVIALLASSSLMAAFTRVAAQDTAWPALVARLEAAALAGKADIVKAERLNVLRILAASTDPNRAALLRYTVAYAGWRVAFAPSLQPKEQVDLLEDANLQLTTILAATPNDAEALGLMASVLGARIAKSPDLGMTLGLQSSQTIERALRLAPTNPRLFLISGQGSFNTPPEYGGSVQEAEASFRAALAAFDKEPATKPWPNWGRFDVHAWLGQALLRRGDKAGARSEYEKALVIAPDSAWVRFSLLPAVR